MKASLCENLELERGPHSAEEVEERIQVSIRSKNTEASTMVGSTKMTFSSPLLRGVYEGGRGAFPHPPALPSGKLPGSGAGGEDKGVSPR